MSLLLKDVALNVGGRPLIKDVSLKIDSGEVVGLLGPNGAGKTTTFNMIIGFIKPDIGDVLLEGKSVTNYPMASRARLGIGYLPQEPSVFRQLTVRQNLDLALAQNDFHEFNCRSRREELIEDFNLNSFIDRKGFQLSGGERRRCEIARALCIGLKGPKYLLLDEPFAGVDPLAVADLQFLIEKLRKKGMGILVTDHNVRETLAITDRSYILNTGEILASGTSSMVANNSLVRSYYLGDSFKL